MRFSLIKMLIISFFLLCFIPIKSIVSRSFINFLSLLPNFIVSSSSIVSVTFLNYSKSTLFSFKIFKIFSSFKSTSFCSIFSTFSISSYTSNFSSIALLSDIDSSLSLSLISMIYSCTTSSYDEDD